MLLSNTKHAKNVIFIHILTPKTNASTFFMCRFPAAACLRPLPNFFILIPANGGLKFSEAFIRWRKFLGLAMLGRNPKTCTPSKA
jgi:hypothetical protein